MQTTPQPRGLTEPLLRSRVWSTALTVAAATALGVTIRSWLGDVRTEAEVAAAVATLVLVITAVATRCTWCRPAIGAAIIVFITAALPLGAAAVHHGAGAPVLATLALSPLLAAYLLPRGRAAALTTAVLVIVLLQILLVPSAARRLEFASPDDVPLATARIGMISVAVLLSALFARAHVQQSHRLFRQQEARERLHAALVAHTRDMVSVTDLQGNIHDLNEAAERFFGQELQSGTAASLYVDPEQRRQLLATLQRDGAVTEFESQMRIKGRLRTVSGSSVLLRDSADGSHRILSILRDVTPAHLKRVELERLASTDSLTGLKNRSALIDRLELELDRFNRSETPPFSVLMIDFDEFKEINDLEGHLVGDQLLTEVARRFSAVIREHDLLARYGGDEFAVVATSCASLRAAEGLIQVLRSELSEPLSVAGRTLQASVTIGIGISQPGDTAVELLQRADAALYTEKRRGRRT